MDLRKWREDKDLSQAATARMFEISVPYLSQLENRRRVPSAQLARKIEEITNRAVTLRDLVGKAA